MSKNPMQQWQPLLCEQGFFYNRLPQPANGSALAGPNAQDRQRQLWYHIVGTPQAQDTHVLALPEQPDASIMARVTSDKQCAPVPDLSLFWHAEMQLP